MTTQSLELLNQVIPKRTQEIIRFAHRGAQLLKIVAKHQVGGVHRTVSVPGARYNLGSDGCILEHGYDLQKVRRRMVAEAAA